MYANSSFSEFTFGQLSSFLDVTVKSTAVLTRLGLYGGPRGQYGDFSGKVSVDVAIAPSGGWIVRDVFDTLSDRKRRNLQALREKLEEVKEIPGIDGEIALLLHKDDEKELIESSLKELENLVKSASRTQIEQEFNERVAKAFTRASVQGNFSALQALEREMDRVREEEAFFLIAAVMILQ